MKSIGFIDYYISEWHANNYPNWIRQLCEESGKDFEVKYAWAEKEISPVDGRSTDQWCQEFGVTRCNSIEELCERSDYVLILSPSNPEKHLEYAKKVFPFRKHTYIDKTFAPDFETAKTIFCLGEEYGTRFFSSSALRYATELSKMGDASTLITFGGGSNLDEYIIHQIEMAVKVLAEKPTRVRVEKQAEQFICSIEFQCNKYATLIYAPPHPFMAISLPSAEDHHCREIQSDFFMLLLQDILRFYETGESSFDPNQTLDVMCIRDGIMKGKETLSEWIPLSPSR